MSYNSTRVTKYPVSGVKVILKENRTSPGRLSPGTSPTAAPEKDLLSRKFSMPGADNVYVPETSSHVYFRDKDEQTQYTLEEVNNFFRDSHERREEYKGSGGLRNADA